MKIYETKWFARWRRKQAIPDDALCTAVGEIEQGLSDGNLGGSLYKKRVPTLGRGKRGSYRTLLAFKAKNRAIFIFGFPKTLETTLTARKNEH